MILKPLKPRKALNKAFLKVKPTRAEIDHFKANLIRLLNRTVDTESEEFHKNLVSMFLRDTWYKPNHFINTKGRTDLVIHIGPDAKSHVGVIIEAKRPNNKAEMPSCEKINTKAVQELVLYYMRERVLQNNLEIKHLIATDTYEWFIFDATLFDRLFAQNKHFVQQYNDFANGRLADSRTDFFYKQIAEPFIESITAEIEFAYFNLRDYLEPLRNKNKDDDNKLIALFKLLSPEHLLKLPFANDSNTLDKRFYGELLHIIGLTEIKKGGKKLIERNKEGERNSGSILEDAIIQIESLNKINRLKNPDDYGKTSDERFFNVALELSITWINRILFLKLLEAQLINYHDGDKSYAFLNKDRIKSYDDLNTLFFQVLARNFEERNPDVSRLFEKVPYLNSSLFEPTGLEHDTLMISNLRDNKAISIHAHTVLKDRLGKKRSGELNTLEYLFAFLDAYDFSSEGSEEIQEESKTLINASVLGLIFEKINGYKDGSFFTPGFITMYMCRETIRRAVVQKFNETKAWNCQNLDDLYDKIEDRNEANKIMNSLKICDPAVGSGHFLVSALNEIIAVKSDLRVLQDRKGRRLKEYHVEVANDELVVTDEEGRLFEYKPGSPESQRVQEALFHEKQTIIENCLFGVDINPNSVKICRLRLWIELLKNAYYKTSTELETLPNIDINIKCGNSLVSRFAIDADLKQIAKSAKWNIFSYQNAVESYKRNPDKDVKQELEKLIQNIRLNYVETIQLRNPKLQKYKRLKQEYDYRFPENGLFAMEPEATYGGDHVKLEEQKQKLITEIEKLRAELETEKRFYDTHKAFEWRFEFPEVLNEDGDFIGFDVVMGNPPYIRHEELGALKTHLHSNYKVYAPGGDIFSYFYELGHKIIRENAHLSFINNTFDKTTAGKALRMFVNENYSVHRYIDLTEVVVFDEATTYPVIIIAQKSSGKSSFRFFKFQNSHINNKGILYDETELIKVAQEKLDAPAWSFVNIHEQNILTKIQRHPTIRERFGKCFYGIKTALNEAFVVEKNLGSHDVLKAVYDGKDVKKWITPPPRKKMIVFESKSTVRKFGNISEEDALKKMRENYPEVFQHLELHEEKAAKRYDKGDYWWELRNCAYYDLFEKPKIIFPNLQNVNKFSYDDSGVYLNAPAVFLPTDDFSVLAILNSRVVWYFLKSICVIRRGGYIEVKPQYFEQIPIPDIDNSTKSALIELTEEIIKHRKDNQQADISALEFQIDQLVYRLYGLTEEEIGIVVGGD